MAKDEEFADYVGSRWPRLVRSAVLLGCSPAEAEDLVQTSLMKCLVKWSQVQRAEDCDAYVHRVLIKHVHLVATPTLDRRECGPRPAGALNGRRDGHRR